MSNVYHQYLDVIKALSDVNRLTIVDMLSCGEMCACEILKKLHIMQPTLSHHMKILSSCGLVHARKDGKWMYYSLNQPEVDNFINFLIKITRSKSDCICNSSND